MPDGSTPPAPPPVLQIEAQRKERVPEAALDIVTEFEGYREAAYRCPAGVVTYGIGSTRGPDGRPVRMGMKISRENARKLLERDLWSAGCAVTDFVRVPLKEHERAALCSFIYNIGAHAFRASTLLRLLNGGERAAAAAEFGKWTRGGGKILPGLVRRRAAEERLFMGLEWR